ncbi:MAG: adenylate/guanylate cyclase domain-containing protein, partial [Chloroflexota bacterium]
MELVKGTARARVAKNYTVFLFADLRDFSQYTRLHGDEAAYRLVQRFYALVRSKVTRAGGADWKTDGDQILFTFNSAHAAVLAALSVGEAIVAYNGKNPGSPIQAGIGLDAGEPVVAGGDFIGTAVNRAARITAVAKAGQILVTESIRQLAQNVPGVQFADGGVFRLKGFPEPERLYQPRRPGITLANAGSSAFGRILRPGAAIQGRAALAAVACCVGIVVIQARPAATTAAIAGAAQESSRTVVAPVNNTDAPRGVQAIFTDARRYTALVTAIDSTESRTGAGIVVDQGGTAVTAAHTVGNSPVVKVSLGAGRVVPAAVVRVDREADIAVLRLSHGSYDAAEIG